ncbi:MAG: rRNA pseudouridine synthase [Hyphomonadaceae bacterium]|nr:rRNA pseudouridine synthase [Hyphomonadaceae bacterium]
MARAGVASRREAERMIEAGRVAVNGKRLDTPAFLVTPKDKITVDGAGIGGKMPPRLWRYHKPDGLLTTHRDPGGRPTVFENLPEDLPRVISVGRLDMTSEGLLLLTNDGELARMLELPSTGWARRYRARAWGKTDQYALDKLMKGVDIDGIPTGPIEAKLDKQQGDNAWISVTIREGKNREVRRALETLNLKVNRLIRLSYGPFQLGDLLKGGIEEVPNRILRDQVGHLVEIPKTRPEGQITAKPGKKPFKGKRSTKQVRKPNGKPITIAKPKPKQNNAKYGKEKSREIFGKGKPKKKFPKRTKTRK